MLYSFCVIRLSKLSEMCASTQCDTKETFIHTLLVKNLQSFVDFTIFLPAAILTA